MIWVLIGEGPNCLQIPAMVWNDKTNALADCKAMLGETFKTNEKGTAPTYSWNIERDRTDYSDEEDNEDGESNRPKVGAAKLYTSYYDGCGECYRATLKAVEEGEPFVRWDLD